MNDEKSTLDSLVEALSRERDELRVKLELAKMEIRDQWDPLEDKWGSVEAKMRSVSDATSESGKEVLKASKLLLHEIGDAYKKIWKQIKD